ncbi:MAG: PEP-utilizing enzyme [Oscillospiraceae bacterium]
MQVAQGILTVRGGMTSHAAVVARGMGTCCVSGCGEIVVDYDNKCFTLAGKTYQRGRLDLHRRLHRQHLRRGHPHRARRPLSGDFGRFMRLGRRSTAS